MTSGGLMVVVPSFHLGGAERVATLLASGAARHGVHTCVAALDGEGPLRESLAPMVRIEALGAPRARQATIPLLRLVHDLRPEVVLSSQTHLNAMMGIIAPALPRSTRVVVRESETRSGDRVSDLLVRLGHRTIYRGIDTVLASSPWMAADLARRHRGHIEILPNPVDVMGRRASVRPRRHPGPGLRLVHVGRLIPQKRVEGLVEAFSAARRPDDRLTIVGDGISRHDVTTAILRHGLSASVDMLGETTQVDDIVAGADALVLTSSAEGMPNVVLEALALGTPVIAADDLRVLEDLAHRLGPSALRLVPYRHLAEVLAATTPRHDLTPDSSGGLRIGPSLLPEEHDLERVSSSFVSMTGLRTSSGLG